MRLRTVGIDHLVFSENPIKPVYVVIKSNREIEILDASNLWGMHTEKTRASYGAPWKRFRGIMYWACRRESGTFCKRYNVKMPCSWKNGMGCVMGSKKLKAIVVEKKIGKPQVCKPEKVKEIRDQWIKKCPSIGYFKIGEYSGYLNADQAVSQAGGIAYP